MASSNLIGGILQGLNEGKVAIQKQNFEQDQKNLEGFRNTINALINSGMLPSDRMADAAQTLMDTYTNDKAATNPKAVIKAHQDKIHQWMAPVTSPPTAAGPTPPPSMAVPPPPTAMEGGATPVGPQPMGAGAVPGVAPGQVPAPTQVPTPPLLQQPTAPPFAGPTTSAPQAAMDERSKAAIGNLIAQEKIKRAFAAPVSMGIHTNPMTGETIAGVMGPDGTITTKTLSSVESGKLLPALNNLIAQAPNEETRNLVKTATQADLVMGDIKGAVKTATTIIQQEQARQEQIAARKSAAASAKEASQTRQNTTLTDSAIKNAQTEINKLYAPVAERLRRATQALDQLDMNSIAADGAIAPEMITILAGGQGSGVRITQAEVNAVGTGAMTVWNKIKSAASKLGPNSGAFLIPPDQRADFFKLLQMVRSKAQDQLNMFNEASADLNMATSPREARNVLMKFHKSYGDLAGTLKVPTPMEAGASTPPPGSRPVTVNGAVVGYTTDGKTMIPIGQ